jgi:uncharacterized membrane-anchored protein
MDKHAAAKVPAVTLVFWVLKVFATTLGETAGDTRLRAHPAARRRPRRPAGQADREGGFAFSRPLASALLLGAMVRCVLVFPQRVASRAH